MSEPFKIGIIGMGGYAISHHEAILQLERTGTAQLVCTCDPNPAGSASRQKQWEFSRRKIRVFDDYREMLFSDAERLDVVIVPTPIPLHLDMHQACVEAGVACYLEKPPTLVYTELEQMIDRDLTAQKKTFVGFNYISEPTRLRLKQRLLAGDFGRVMSGSLTALWRRSMSYFQRNNWGGRLRHEGQLVLDSCFGNAMAHFVHNMLFWVGRDQLYSWGMIDDVRAELYRANEIEGADTFFVEATAGGVPLRFALTHACGRKEYHVEVLECELATIRFMVGGQVEIDWNDGLCEMIPLPPYAVPYENHLDYFRYLRGDNFRPSTTLKDCRPFVYLNDLAHISSGMIGSPPPDKLTLEPHDDASGPCVAIAGIEQDIERFIVDGLWPGAHGWGRESSPRLVTPQDLPQLNGVVDAMLESVAAGSLVRTVPA
jgi:predicted dehydrogenase